MTMDDKYCLLVTFLVNICPKPMRELFVILAQATLPVGTIYTTLDAYLKHRKPDVLKLKNKKLLRQDQYDLLYPSNGQADVETWDITLLSLLLQHLFPNNISQAQTNISSIRKIRNDLQHISGTAKVSDADFSSLWSTLETATLGLANHTKGSAYEDEIRNEIMHTKTSYITSIGDILRQWYSDHILELKDELDTLKQKIDKIETNTAKTEMILNKTSRKRKRHDGTCYKWLNPAPALEKMRTSFELTLRRYIHNYTCQSTKEIDQILTELHSKHFALVSGFGHSLYLETTLSAIKKDYDKDKDRCVEVSNALDWDHVDSKDVSLALFVHPFDQDILNQEKSRDMKKLLDNIEESTKEEDGDAVDVVIVTDQMVLNAFTAKYGHSLLKHPIRLFQETTERLPAIIDSEIIRVDESEHDPNHKNLVQSIAYYREHNLTYTDENTIQSAETMFRSRKVLTICGPRGCGKTSLAIHLLKHYQEGHYLVITEPADIAHVRFGVTCVILIEDLCGKYNYDSNVAFKWFRKFDVIYSLVKQGKLNVVITCDEDMLKRLKKDISEHPLLENVMTLRSIGAVRIKQEPGSTTGCSVAAGSSIFTRTHGALRFTHASAGKNVDVDDVDDRHDTPRIAGICQITDGTVFVLYQDLINWPVDSFIIHYDVNLHKLRRYPDEEDEQDDEYDFYDVRGICCTETGKLVVLNWKGIQVFKVENKLLLQNTVTALDGDRVFSCGDKIAVWSNGYPDSASLCLYDSDLRLKGKYTYPDFVYNEDEIFHYVIVDQGYNTFRCSKNWIISININQKQIKYHRFKDGFDAQCMCRCEEDSVLVLGKQDEFKCQEDGSIIVPKIWSILQLNKDLDILSAVKCKIPDLKHADSMFYDRERHRILVAKENYIHEVYLE